MRKGTLQIAVACLVLFAALADLGTPLRHLLNDARFGWVQRETTGKFTLVAIDARSITEIGVWPWPREVHAELVEALDEAGALDIVFDIDFSARSTVEADRRLATALAGARAGVALAAFAQPAVDEDGSAVLQINRPLPEFERQAWTVLVNVVPDADGIIRRYPVAGNLGGEPLPSLSGYLSGFEPSGDTPLTIDFGIRSESFTVVSAIDVLKRRREALAAVEGRAAIIGATAIELGDRFNVPGGRIIPGAILQMLAAETLIQDRALRSAPAWLLAVCLAALLVASGLLRKHRCMIRHTATLLGGAILVEAAAILVQAQFALVVETALIHLAILACLVILAVEEIGFGRLLENLAQQRFDQIAMSIGDGLICTNESGEVTVWNRAAGRIFDRDAKDMIGAPLSRIIPEAGGDSATSRQFLDKFNPGKAVECNALRANGEVFPIELCLSRWETPEANLQYGIVVRDITVRKREAERVRKLAEYDTLTNVANRHKLNDYLSTALSASEARPRLALIAIDLNGFKEINDTFGHGVGDKVLVFVAETLSRLVGASGLIARLGGDEFAVVLHEPEGEQRAEVLARQFLRILEERPLEISGRPLLFSASLGIARYPRDSGSVSELLSNADLAMYRAKAMNRGGFSTFDHELRKAVDDRRALEAELGEALARGEFVLYFQPQVDLANDAIIGAEALIRWNHPTRGLLPPSAFIEIAIVSSHAAAIAQWTIEEACRQGAEWARTGMPLRIGVNLAPLQFRTGDLTATVLDILRMTGLPAHLLELEVTENILLADDERTRETFAALRRAGIRIAFDDFGTGFASLTHLRCFPIDCLKIDRSFVMEIEKNKQDSVIVRSVIDLARSLGISVIAEGIEDQRAADLLKDMGCREGQGYFFGRPKAPMDFVRAVKAHQKPVPQTVDAARGSNRSGKSKAA
jgi:diguanylate cyclase (GGDEF)-like protein/PAS domain S-box-containing protein